MSFSGKESRLGLLYHRGIQQFYNLACNRHDFNGVSRPGMAGFMDNCSYVYVPHAGSAKHLPLATGQICDCEQIFVSTYKCYELCKFNTKN